MQESIVFLVRVQCRRKESSRSLSHLLMSFLLLLMTRGKSIALVLSVTVPCYDDAGEFHYVLL